MFIAEDPEAPERRIAEEVPPIAPNKEDPSAPYRNLNRNRNWHDYKAMDLDKKRQGKGEQGSPVALPSDPDTKELEEKVYRVNGFDGLVSDQISLNRSVKDIRHPGCKKERYLQRLPTVSVILPFHNEASQEERSSLMFNLRYFPILA